MGNGRSKLYVAHPLAAHLGLDHLHAALVAHNAAVLHPLVLSAEALPVLDGAEYLGAEQAVTLRLERTIIDGLRLFHLAVRPLPDTLGRRNPYANRIKVHILGFLE